MFTAQGKEAEVVNFFAMSPHLIRSLTAKNDVEDYSGRCFKNISAFQYALWARDWHLWERMLKALDEAYARALTTEEWEALPEHQRNQVMTLTKVEVADIRTRLKQQYDEVVGKGLDYTITRMGENGEPMVVHVKGETHFDLIGPEFCLMPQEANFVPEKGKIYIKIGQDSLHYTLVSLSGEAVSDSIPLEQLAPLTQLNTAEDIKPFITPLLKITSMRGHTHPQALISSLNTYCEQYNNWNWSQRENHWCHQVGMAQREVPAHIAQEYCRTDLALTKKRSFTELEFPRTLEFYSWVTDSKDTWFPLHKEKELGNDFGIFNYNNAPGDRRVKRIGGWGSAKKWGDPQILQENLAGLLTLCKVRFKQLIELGERLLKQAQQEMDLEVEKDNSISYS
ncbi:hypothetical protein [Legionella maceachernii]|nr:hypothetical protein [Legionella maceachernii]